MASTKIETSDFRDFASTALPYYGQNGIELDEVNNYTSLTSGSGNGVYFEFNSAGYIIFYNASTGLRTFTFLLEEPNEYEKLGISFSNKTVSVGPSEKHILPVDSRYKQADGNIYIESSGTDCKLQIIKRYTIV